LGRCRDPRGQAGHEPNFRLPILPDGYGIRPLRHPLFAPARAGIKKRVILFNYLIFNNFF
jgi:hypothetical protein